MVLVKIETLCNFFASCLMSKSIPHPIHWLIFHDNFWGRRTTGWKGSLRITVGAQETPRVFRNFLVLLRVFQTFWTSFEVAFKKSVFFVASKPSSFGVQKKPLKKPKPQKKTSKGIWLFRKFFHKHLMQNDWGFESFGSVRYANIGSKAPESGANGKRWTVWP